MSAYLKEAQQAEAMAVFYAPEDQPPLVHTIWTSDFMCLAKHNVPCPVCFDAHASLERNVTPGQWSQSFGPCRDCAKDGWELRRKPRWQRLFSQHHGAGER